MKKPKDLPDARHCRGLTSGKFRKHALIFYADANRTESRFVQIMAVATKIYIVVKSFVFFFQLLRCTNGPISHNIHNSQLPHLTISHATTCPVEICHSQLPQNQPPATLTKTPSSTSSNESSKLIKAQ